MRKNKMMRAASGLLVATLLTTSVISGTFAKYTTSAEGTDTARVATWGFDKDSTITINDLFTNSYGETVKSNSDVIAPGTSGEAKFGFSYAGQETAPEVAYTFNVDTAGSNIANDIKNNTNIQWKLDNNVWGTWEDLLTAIQALDGNITASDQNNQTENYYAPNTLPTAFNAKGNNEHTVAWQWKFDGNDTADTNMGNKSTLDSVTLKITITATQVD